MINIAQLVSAADHKGMSVNIRKVMARGSDNYRVSLVYHEYGIAAQTFEAIWLGEAIDAAYNWLL